MNAGDLVARLQGVRLIGPCRWVAKCPAHDDRIPSLAIRECEDRRLLLHCFAGCPTDSVLEALSLTFSDIMPEGLKNHARPERASFDAQQCLEAVAHEMTAAVLICENVAGGSVATQVLRDRLMLAAKRINRAVGMCGPPKIRDATKALRRGEYRP